jgi:AraC-like DNA-binding protein
MAENLFPSKVTLHPLHKYHPKQPLPHPFAETTGKVLTGPYGTILYQQIAGEYMTFRHYRCFIKHASQVPCIEMEDRAFVCINLKNTVAFRFGDSTDRVFFEWACNLFFCTGDNGMAIFRKESEYSFFTIHFNDQYLEPFVQSYSFGSVFLDAVHHDEDAALSNANFPANQPMRTAISDILYNEFSDFYYQVYLAVKCQELLMPFMKQCDKESGAYLPVCEEDANAIYTVKEKLLAEMHELHVLDELAEFANLSEYKLKNGFRQIYGMLIFDFLHEARMKKAYTLVTGTQLPYDIIASLVGYQSITTFFNQFKKYAGISPKRLRDGIQGKGTRLNTRPKRQAQQQHKQ